MQTLYRNEKPDDLQPVMDCFQGTPLQKIVLKAKFLLALDQALQPILPESFRYACHVMNVHQGVVILGVSNASIATRIQFLSANLLQELRKKREYAQLTGIQCKVCAKTVRY